MPIIIVNAKEKKTKKKTVKQSFNCLVLNRGLFLYCVINIIYKCMWKGEGGVCMQVHECVCVVFL